MTFTDDDLKRLKESIDYNLSMHDYYESPIRCDVLMALLARLEAAEKIIGNDPCSRNSDTRCICGWREDYEAWRKACGR